MNYVKTFMLMAALTALVVGVGWLLGGYGGMAIALGIAAVMNFFSYWYSDRLILRLYRAQEVDPGHDLHAMVAELAERAAIPTPRVYIIPDQTPNAFATGRSPKRAAVAATEGLLRVCNREEVMAVMAHEIGHVLNRDTLIGTVTATMAGAISMLGSMLMWSAMLGGRNSNNPIGAIGMLLAIIVAPIAASMIQMAISRSREYQADQTGARLMGSGVPLANALRALEHGVHAIPPEREPEPATAHMFIVNPLSGRGLGKLFSTHPPMSDRIERLMRFKA